MKIFVLLHDYLLEYARIVVMLNMAHVCETRPAAFKNSSPLKRFINEDYKRKLMFRRFN